MNIQEVLVDSVADLILDVIDMNDVHEAFKNKNEQVVSKKNKKDKNPPQEKILDKALMPMVGCAITATDEIGKIVEELIIAALNHSDEVREAQDIEDLGESKNSSALHIEMVNAVQDESLEILELKVNRAKETIEVELLDPSKSIQGSTLKFEENLFIVKNDEQIKPTNPLSSNKEVKKKANKSKNVQPNTQGDKMALVEKEIKKYRKKEMSKSEPLHRIMINDSELVTLLPAHPSGQVSSVILESLGGNLDIAQKKGNQVKTMQFESLDSLEPKQNSSKVSSLENPKGHKENIQVEMLDAFKIKSKDSVITTSLSAEKARNKKAKKSKKGKAEKARNKKAKKSKK